MQVFFVFLVAFELQIDIFWDNNAMIWRTKRSRRIVCSKSSMYNNEVAQ